MFPHLKQCEKLYTIVSSEQEWNLTREISGRLELFYNIKELFLGEIIPLWILFSSKCTRLKNICIIGWFAQMKL